LQRQVVMQPRRAGLLRTDAQEMRKHRRTSRPSRSR
jgi:hypothetical protein